MEGASLVSLFAEAVGRDVDPALAAAELARQLEAAEARWPALTVSREGFVRHLGARLASAPDVLEALREVAAADLYLAFACAGGDHAAERAYDALLREAFRAVAARLGLEEDARDDVLQRVRERLIVGREGAPARLLAYAGRGPLAAWTRVAALRTAYNVLAERGSREVAVAPDGLSDLVAASDPELEVLARSYGAALQGSVRDAIRGLAARDRALLRYALVESLSVDQVGKIYGVHRATAARWIAAARERLHGATRDAFRRATSLSEHELESIVRSLRSFVDASVEALLAPDE